MLGWFNFGVREWRVEERVLGFFDGIVFLLHMTLDFVLRERHVGVVEGAI
jgi:hypothetical protein